MKIDIDRIQELSNAFGPSGFEKDVVRLIRGYFDGSGYVLKEDSMHNLYVRKEKKGTIRVQLDAHTDEVGFMVQSVLPQGTMRLAPIGSWNPAQVSSLRLVAKNAKGEMIPGVVASLPPHFGESGLKGPAISEMAFDVGAIDSRELRESYEIGLGAPLVPYVQSRYDEKRGKLYGKAFDCRIGCAALIDTLLTLGTMDRELDIVGTFSSQEEVGFRGAIVSAEVIKPDVAIVFEGAPADDTFFADEIQCALGKGPMLRHMDKSMITNPRFQRFALDVAREMGIPCQEAVRLGGGTNAAAIHLTKQAVPTIVIGVPVRYIHAGEGIALRRDVEGAVQLAVSIVERLHEEIVRSF